MYTGLCTSAMGLYGIFLCWLVVRAGCSSLLVEGNNITMSVEDSAYMEKLYSPSQWSKRMGPDEVIQNHVKFVTEVSERVKKTIPNHLDVPYGPTERQKVDIFGTDLPDDSPIFVYIHGGYWQMLSKEVSSYIVEPLYKNGHKVIVIGYDLCPTVTLEQIVDEIQRAFKYCIDYAKRNKSRHLSIGGHSAGAHLSATIFSRTISSLLKEDQDIVKGVYLISGVYDLVPLVKTTTNNALKLTEETASQLSVMNKNISSSNKDISFKVIVGENDSPAFKEQSETYEKKLRADGWNAELIVVEEVDHFDIVEKLSDENYQITKMIVK